MSGEKLWEKPVDFSKCENMLYLIHAEGILVVSGSDQNKHYHIYAYDVSSPALRFGTENPEIQELWRESATGSKEDRKRFTHHGGHLQHPLVVGQTLYSDWRAFDLRSGDRKKDITVPPRRGCGNWPPVITACFTGTIPRQCGIWIPAQQQHFRAPEQDAGWE